MGSPQLATIYPCNSFSSDSNRCSNPLNKKGADLFIVFLRVSATSQLYSFAQLILCLINKSAASRQLIPAGRLPDQFPSWVIGGHPQITMLSPTIHKFGDEFIHSGLSVVRHAHHPEFFEGLSEYGKAFH